MRRGKWGGEITLEGCQKKKKKEKKREKKKHACVCVAHMMETSPRVILYKPIIATAVNPVVVTLCE